ncbi:putative uncharacterized protein DDB_G0282133 [Condylostylus longicornis]|uniref:putative uncharacterized protein DDB_G0282133 n=1 Tax=Condylostylus longicornis TaxID=2530218 RepID=UPI00244E3994|nr:putative uncharacterized protein DDB_G0282133 [Condylostylus longicornis]
MAIATSKKHNIENIKIEENFDYSNIKCCIPKSSNSKNIKNAESESSYSDKNYRNDNCSLSKSKKKNKKIISHDTSVAERIQQWNRAIPQKSYVTLGTIRYGIRLSTNSDPNSFCTERTSNSSSSRSLPPTPNSSINNSYNNIEDISNKETNSSDSKTSSIYHSESENNHNSIKKICSNYRIPTRTTTTTSTAKSSISRKIQSSTVMSAPKVDCSATSTTLSESIAETATVTTTTSPIPQITDTTRFDNHHKIILNEDNDAPIPPIRTTSQIPYFKSLENNNGKAYNNANVNNNYHNNNNTVIKTSRLKQNQKNSETKNLTKIPTAVGNNSHVDNHSAYLVSSTQAQLPSISSSSSSISQSPLLCTVTTLSPVGSITNTRILTKNSIPSYIQTYEKGVLHKGNTENYSNHTINQTKSCNNCFLNQQQKQYNYKYQQPEENHSIKINGSSSSHYHEKNNKMCQTSNCSCSNTKNSAVKNSNDHVCSHHEIKNTTDEQQNHQQQQNTNENEFGQISRDNFENSESVLAETRTIPRAIIQQTLDTVAQRSLGTDRKNFDNNGYDKTKTCIITPCTNNGFNTLRQRRLSPPPPVPPKPNRHQQVVRSKSVDSNVNNYQYSNDSLIENKISSNNGFNNNQKNKNDCIESNDSSNKSPSAGLDLLNCFAKSNTTDENSFLNRRSGSNNYQNGINRSFSYNTTTTIDEKLKETNGNHNDVNNKTDTNCSPFLKRKISIPLSKNCESDPTSEIKLYSNTTPSVVIRKLTPKLTRKTLNFGSNNDSNSNTYIKNRADSEDRLIDDNSSDNNDLNSYCDSLGSVNDPIIETHTNNNDKSNSDPNFLIFGEPIPLVPIYKKTNTIISPLIDKASILKCNIIDSHSNDDIGFIDSSEKEDSDFDSHLISTDNNHDKIRYDWNELSDLNSISYNSSSDSNSIHSNNSNQSSISNTNSQKKPVMQHHQE